MGIVSGRKVCTTLQDMGKVCVIVACRVHMARHFSFASLRITSLQSRQSGDSVIAAHVYYNTAHHSYAIIAQFGNSSGTCR